MNKKIKVYVDMDGVIAKWENVPQERTFDKGYFLYRKPEDVMVEFVQYLIEHDVDVRILSSAYTNGYAVHEKREWLNKNGLSNVDAIFVPYGDDKSNYVTTSEDTINVLIDDYTPNAFAWERNHNHICVKYYNDFNGSHGRWHGRYLTSGMEFSEMLNIVTLQEDNSWEGISRVVQNDELSRDDIELLANEISKLLNVVNDTAGCIFLNVIVEVGDELDIDVNIYDGRDRDWYDAYIFTDSIHNQDDLQKQVFAFLNHFVNYKFEETFRIYLNAEGENRAGELITTCDRLNEIKYRIRDMYSEFRIMCETLLKWEGE